MSSPQEPPQRRQRVPALPPAERRNAIIAATLPLLREHGPIVSTRQIAEAAGVSEGTIFKVFPDKRSLIHAALLSAFDPAPVERALRDIDPHDDLRTRMRAVASIARRTMGDNGRLLSAMRKSSGAHAHGFAHGHPHSPQVAGEFFAEMTRSKQRLIAAVAAVIEPDRATLRHPPTVVAELLLSILAIQGHGGLAEIDGIDTTGIVTLLLDGLLIRQNPTITGDPASC